MADKHISVTELRRRFEYHPNGWLIRKVRTASNTYIGQIVKGHKRKEYLFLMVKKQKVAFHRAVFALVHGKYPKGLIDHIDRNTVNNRVENLREVTLSQNMFNRKIHVNNKTGYKGIWWNKSRHKWKVVLGANGKYHFIGEFSSKDAAIQAQKKAIARFHGEFKLKI